jgi:rubrerythrin
MQELSFAEIMSYATIAEDNAIAFYKGAAAKARGEVKSSTGSWRMEQGTSATSKSFSSSSRRQDRLRKVHTLGYAEFIKPVTLDADTSYKEALEAAMVKERDAVATYEKLAIYIDDPDAKQVFTLLHEEEKKHLKRFETEYDDLTNQNW